MKKFTEESSEAKSINDLQIDFQCFQCYEKGWDGEEALPLTPQVIDNFKKILKLGDRETLSGRRVFPEDNGNLLIESKTTAAGVNLGNDAFSRYSFVNGHALGENHVPYSPQALLNVIASFNQSH